MDTIFDKKKIYENCKDFFSLYEHTNGRVRDMCIQKMIHTDYVADNCYEIAQNLGLDEYDSDIAWIIGEIHDFARFGQAVVTKTYRDSEMFNHAKLGARILFAHRLIEDIIPNFNDISPEDQLVMEKAVYHHSDFVLPDDLTERQRMFCNIIREADQIDIFRTIVTSGWMTIYGFEKEDVEESEISEDIAKAFYAHELADYSKRDKPADYHLAHIALCFGLKDLAARARVAKQGYLHQMMDITFHKPHVQKKYEELKAEVESFLAEN